MRQERHPKRRLALRPITEPARCPHVDARAVVGNGAELRPQNDGAIRAAFALPHHYAALMRAQCFSPNFNLKERP